MIVIVYTTRYREGGPRFAQAARTLAARLRAEHPREDVRCRPVESKADVRAVLAEAADITQLHFVGHGGLYGPMFGTTDWPEQFSPHEWRSLEIPFAPGAEAHIHACRSARWFAPFFARTFGVRTTGYHWYTTFSSDPERFVFVPPWGSADAPLYVAGCPGACTHDLAVLPVLRAALPHLRTVIDPARALAERFDPSPRTGATDRFWTTGDPLASREAAARAFGVEAPFEPAGSQLPAP